MLNLPDVNIYYFGNIIKFFLGYGYNGCNLPSYGIRSYEKMQLDSQTLE